MAAFHGPNPIFGLGDTIYGSIKMSMRYSKIAKQTGTSKNDVKKVFDCYVSGEWILMSPDNEKYENWKTLDSRLLYIAEKTGIDYKKCLSIYKEWEKNWGDMKFSASFEFI